MTSLEAASASHPYLLVVGSGFSSLLSFSNKPQCTCQGTQLGGRGLSSQRLKPAECVPAGSPWTVNLKTLRTLIKQNEPSSLKRRDRQLWPCLHHLWCDTQPCEHNYILAVNQHCRELHRSPCAKQAEAMLPPPASPTLLLNQLEQLFFPHAPILQGCPAGNRAAPCPLDPGPGKLGSQQLHAHPRRLCQSYSNSCLLPGY